MAVATAPARRTNGRRNIKRPMMDEARAAKAIAHPLRKAILEKLDGEVLSPSDMADTWEHEKLPGKARVRKRKVKRMGAIGNVSYHCRILLRIGAIKLVKTQQVRGAVEHFYTATVRIKPMTWEEVE